MSIDDSANTKDSDKPDPKRFRIRIDRTDYIVTEEKLSGAQLREVPSPSIPPDRDLYQVIAGHEDLKIKDDDTVQIYDGLRLFTAPNTINPGVAHATSRTA